MKKRLAVILFSLLIVYIAGCGNNPSGVDNSILVDHTTAQTSGLANLKVVLSPKTVSSIRASGIGTRAFVRIILFIANPGSSTNLYTQMQKVVELTSSTTSVNASFSSVPAKPTLVKIILTDASINSKKSFHGVVDLIDGDNSVIPVAVGAENASDTAAKVFEEFLQSPTLMAKATNTLVDTISGKIATVGNDTYAALNAIAKDIVTSGFVDIISTNSGASIKVGTIEIANTIFWNDTSTKLKLKKILRPGIDGFAYTFWQSDDNTVSAIAKVSTANGSNSSYCKNSGKLDNFVVLSDNSIIAGGYNSVKNCPVVFKWVATSNANVDTKSGLQWCYYFETLTGTSSLSAIDRITFDADGSLLLDVRKASDNSLIDFRLDANTGAIPGIAEITAAYPNMESILQNNSLTSQQRVDSFMTYIAEDFRDIAGHEDKKSDLAATTISRLDRYIINSYSFTLGNIEVVNSTTIKVTTPSVISVTRKPGATGAVSSAYITVTPIPVITWKYYLSGWKIYQGLPYTSAEISL